MIRWWDTWFCWKRKFIKDISKGWLHTIGITKQTKPTEHAKVTVTPKAIADFWASCFDWEILLLFQRNSWPSEKSLFQTLNYTQIIIIEYNWVKTKLNKQTSQIQLFQQHFLNCGLRHVLCMYSNHVIAATLLKSFNMLIFSHDNSPYPFVFLHFFQGPISLLQCECNNWKTPYCMDENLSELFCIKYNYLTHYFVWNITVIPQNDNPQDKSLGKSDFLRNMCCIILQNNFLATVNQTVNNKCLNEMSCLCHLLFSTLLKWCL